jgi:hypothetical protein
MLYEDIQKKFIIGFDVLIGVFVKSHIRNCAKFLALVTMGKISTRLFLVLEKIFMKRTFRHFAKI